MRHIIIYIYFFTLIFLANSSKSKETFDNDFQNMIGNVKRLSDASEKLFSLIHQDKKDMEFMVKNNE